jgi:hypothetical protein
VPEVTSSTPCPDTTTTITLPASTPVVPEASSSTPVVPDVASSYPAVPPAVTSATGSGYAVPSTTTPALPEYTGAASSNKPVAALFAGVVALGAAMI